MRIERCDIGNSGEVHKAFTEYCDDVGQKRPTTDMWYYKFSDKTYYCYILKHGKRVVGLIWGKCHPYYEQKVLEIDGFFIRKGFRGKMKFVRGALRKFSQAIKEFDAKSVQWSRSKKFRERAIT